MEAGVRFPLGALKNFFIVFVLISCQAYKLGHQEELISAVSKVQLSKVKDLINRGADVNTKDKNGKTILHIAIENNYEDIVKFLIQNKADVNIKDNDGNTPLHLAVKNGNDFIVKLLLKAGAKKDIKNNEGKTPLDLAKEINNIEILKLLNE